MEIDFIESADSINSHNPIEREQMIILRLQYPKRIPRRPAVHRIIHTYACMYKYTQDSQRGNPKEKSD